MNAMTLLVRVVLVAVCGPMLACSGGSGDAHDSADSTANLPAELVPLPSAPAGARAWQIFPAAGRTSRWCVFRGWPNEQLHVFSGCDSTSLHPAPFALAQGSLLPVGVADEGERLWLLVYDADRNSPSGRTSGPVSEGIDVLLFSAGSSAQPVMIAEQLPLGGLDTLIYSHADNGELTVCGIDRCFHLRSGETATEWTDPAMAGYEFVETVIGPDAVKAIVRRRDDHVAGNADFASFHYALAELRAGHAEVTPIASDCIPYALTAGTAVSWRCAQTKAEIADLLRFELARMPNGGLMEFGASNLEGRVAWSQAYYLNGLMQLAGDSLPALKHAGDWSALNSRLRDEIELLSIRVRSTDGLLSKRYSLRRTGVTFALHLGRAARILGNAAHAGFRSPGVEDARHLLRMHLRSLDGTVEQPIQAVDRGRNFATLGYERGTDFWCDGANAPYNYLSGVVDGILSTDEPTRADVDRAAQFMEPLMALEGLDVAAEWRYWWARGSDGWTEADGVSTNTPAYSGNDGVAHITYRSMDAAALVRLRDQRADAVPAEVIANIRALVSAGALLPWVNEALVAAGRATLDPRVAYRYARSSAPWELQSQVWALDQLAQHAAQ